jgi:MSHA biogenesis protein MshM
MYLQHFGLREAPFGITPNPAFFYSGNTRGDMLAALLYAVAQGEGIIKVSGEVGSGKTMLCRMLVDHLPAQVDVVYLANPTLERHEVAYALAGELMLEVGGKRIDEVTRLLQADLIARHAAGRQVLLVIEEAQAMPLDTLEEIRLFSNLETARHKLLQIALFGQPELDTHLDLPRMRQLKERITHSFAVPAMPPDAIADYLAFRLHAAGYSGGPLFSKAAVRHLSKVSQGIVRRINILADKSLLAAFADGKTSVELNHARAASADCRFHNLNNWWSIFLPRNFMRRA